MSITDQIYAWYYVRRNTWILIQGNETFYDENDTLREFETENDAVKWALENLDKDLVYDRQDKDSKDRKE